MPDDKYTKQANALMSGGGSAASRVADVAAALAAVERDTVAAKDAQIEAERARHAAWAEGGWMPIESAPRQRQILLWAVTSVDPPNWRMETGYCCINFDGELEWEWGGRKLKSYDVKPTHWQPLPPPPLPEPAPREGGEG